MKSILSILICLLFIQAVSGKKRLDEINLTYSTYFVRDTAFFTTSSEAFGGDCTYVLALDSLKGNECFISGKYEGDAKCMGECAIDTVCLGVLSGGLYTINYSFIDISGNFETETLWTIFTVPRKRGLDEIDLTYSTYFVRDTAFFTTSSEAFGGDCTYVLALDSLKGNECFISGKYEGNAKCKGECAIDTVCLGVLSGGLYTINYSFIDISGDFETETLWANFTVSPQSIQTVGKVPDLTIRKEGKNGIAFTLKSKSAGGLQLSIFDMNGRENKVYPMDKQVLRINNLIPGIYLYRLENRKGTVYKGKFIIGK